MYNVQYLRLPRGRFGFNILHIEGILYLLKECRHSTKLNLTLFDTILTNELITHVSSRTHGTFRYLASLHRGRSTRSSALDMI